MTPPLTALVEALRPIRLAVDRLQWMERGCACIVNLDDLREAAAALSAFEAEPQGWRDIATAPKDGTPVDLWCRAPGISAGPGRVTECWFFADTWWCYDEHGDGQCRSEVHNATHWQPLPLPPEMKE